jgi:hypothetical protein
MLLAGDDPGGLFVKICIRRINQYGMRATARERRAIASQSIANRVITRSVISTSVGNKFKGLL